MKHTLDWQAMRAEAAILYEWCKQGPSNDPKRDEEMLRRAAELAALGVEAAHLYAATSDKKAS